MTLPQVCVAMSMPSPRPSSARLANLNPGAELPSYAIVNLRVGLESETGGWSLAGLVKNLFEETYYVGGVALGELFQTNSAVPGEPRTWQVELRFEF